MISQMGPVISHAAENILEITKTKEMRKLNNELRGGIGRWQDTD